MLGFDIRFVILTLDSIIVLALLMTLIVRILNRVLASTNQNDTPYDQDGPKTIDQLNIDIPL